jgi:hypothetical protein
MGAAEDGIADQEVVAFFQEAEKGGEDSAHAGGGGETGFRAFEGRETVGEFLDGGVAETAIDISFYFICEYGAHLFRVIVAEAAGEEYG